MVKVPRQQCLDAEAVVDPRHCLFACERSMGVNGRVGVAATLWVDTKLLGEGGSVPKSPSCLVFIACNLLEAPPHFVSDGHAPPKPP